jgi:molybdopterin-containing oxidoreductase family membrane subunit
MGLFQDDVQAAKAVVELRETPWRVQRVHMPIPSHRIDDALKQEKSSVGWFTLAGGVIGFVFGFLLAIFTATRWNIIVSGKPVVALVPFFIVGFEFTILFAIFGNVIGLLSRMRLPRFKAIELYDDGCSGNRFGVLAVCSDGNAEGLEAFFEEKGGEVRYFE